jgi:hypothetical protein
MATDGNRRFRYAEDEVAAIAATLRPHAIDLAVDLRYLEDCAQIYLFRVAAASAALSSIDITKARDDRDRTVKRVRQSIVVGKKADRVSAFVDTVVAQDKDQSRTRLLAQAMLDGRINEWDLRALLARDELSEPGRLAWPGRDMWTHADGRQKGHRASYVNDLVCFWAEDRDIRPDEVSATAADSRRGNHLMDFILAAGSRPMREASEEVGADQLRNIVQDVKTYWVGRPWRENME